MPSNWEDLQDIASKFMSPGNPGAGNRKLAALSKRAVNRIRIIKLVVFLSQLLLILFLLVSAIAIIADVFTHHSVSQRALHINVEYVFWGSCFLAIALAVFLDFVQFHPKFFPRLRLPAEYHPEELAPLLDGLKSGAWKAKAPRGVLPSYIFYSDWSILLFSGAEYKSERRWLCRLWRVPYDGDLEVRQVSPGEEVDAHSCVNDTEAPQIKAVDHSDKIAPPPQPPEGNIELQQESVRMEEIYPPFEAGTLIRSQDYWLAGVPLEQFKLGLEKYLAATCQNDPYKERVETIILTIGRNALRAGKIQADAIDDVRSALKTSNLRCPAESTIKSRLGGSQILGGKEIRAYFTDALPRPPDISDMSGISI